MRNINEIESLASATYELDVELNKTQQYRGFKSVRDFVDAAVAVFEMEKPSLFAYLTSLPHNRDKVIVLADHISTSALMHICSESVYNARPKTNKRWSDTSIERALRYALQARKAK